MISRMIQETHSPSFFLGSNEENIRELVSADIALRFFGAAEKEVWWLRFDEEVPLPLRCKMLNRVRLFDFSQRDWSVRMQDFLDHFGKAENDDSISCLVFDSICFLSSTASKESVHQRMRKILHVLKKLTKNFCSKGVPLIVLGHVDNDLKRPRHFGSLTEVEFNEIKGIFSLVCSVNLKHSPKAMDFTKSAQVATNVGVLDLSRIQANLKQVDKGMVPFLWERCVPGSVIKKEVTTSALG